VNETTAIGPASGARAQRADARRNRASVLDAASRQFAERGLDAQMEEIARQAGVGVGTVYRHFPTKEALLEALADRKFGAKADAAREALEFDDPWDGFVHFMRRATRITAEDLGLSEEVVERAHASGQLRSDIGPEDIPSLVSGVGHAVHAGDRGAPAMSWERYLEIMLAGLRA
jgi:AcrR family transcriptional regulator